MDKLESDDSLVVSLDLSVFPISFFLLSCFFLPLCILLPCVLRLTKTVLNGIEIRKKIKAKASVNLSLNDLILGAQKEGRVPN